MTKNQARRYRGKGGSQGVSPTPFEINSIAKTRGFCHLGVLSRQNSKIVRKIGSPTLSANETWKPPLSKIAIDGSARDICKMGFLRSMVLADNSNSEKNTS